MAIAFDNAGAIDSADNATSASGAYTMSSGANGILILRADDGSGTDTVTGGSYGAASLSKAAGISVTAGDGAKGSIWYCFAPPSGSNTLTLNRSGSSGKLFLRILSYIGASQISFPDNYGTNTGASGTSLTTFLTPSADNSWLLLFAEDQGGPASAGTGATARSASDNRRAFDNGGPISPPSSNSMQFTWSSSAASSAIILSLAPAVASGRRRTLMGVGT